MKRYIKIKDTVTQNFKNINKNLLDNFIYYKSKYNNKLKNNNLSIKFLFLIIIIFSFLKPVADKNYLFFKQLNSEITLIIKGKGDQYILNNKTNKVPLPKEITVNGIRQNYTDFIVYDLEKEQNNIILKWDYNLSNCNSMFYNLTNITYIDLSKVLSSKITNMEKMFYGCISLLAVNFTNFIITPYIKKNEMFSYCHSLIYLDLKNFYISNESNLSIINNTFYEVNYNLIYCINEYEFPIHSLFKKYFNPNNSNCYDICFQNSDKIKFTENKKCILGCKNSSIYKYEYNNICYQKCPNKTIISPFDNNKCAPKNCPNNSPYLNQNNECATNCKSYNLFNKICLLYNLSDIQNEYLANATSKILEGEGLEDALIPEENKTYIFTIASNQKNGFYECEEKIKGKYMFDKNENLFIIKIDTYDLNLNMKKIQYIFYYPKTNHIFSSEVCKNIKIEIPKSISISNDLYNNFFFVVKTV